MKNYELKPTDANILKCLTNNTIDRNDDMYSLVKLLQNIDSGCSIAINGSWGSGKTFFVKQTKMYIDVLNGRSDLSDDDKTKIKNINKGFDIEPFLTIYYDAWKCDNDNDPILSLIYEIATEYSLYQELQDNDLRLVEDVISNLIKFFCGVDFKELLEKNENRNLLTSIKREKDIKCEIDNFIAKLIGNNKKIIIFIDELDRCRPSYAIKLLERVKHYFDNDKVIFVFSINSSELQHTIKKFYGENFDGSRYLNKFFDVQFELSKVDMKKYLRCIDLNVNNNLLDFVCLKIISMYNLSLRESNRLITSVKMSVGEYFEKTYPSLPRYEGECICCGYIVPLAIALRFISMDEYNKFIGGKNYAPLLELANNIGIHYFNILLSEGESFNSKDSNSKYVTLEYIIKQTYDAIFNIDYNGIIYGENVGKCIFNIESKEMVLNALKGLQI